MRSSQLWRLPQPRRSCCSGKRSAPSSTDGRNQHACGKIVKCIGPMQIIHDTKRLHSRATPPADVSHRRHTALRGYVERVSPVSGRIGHKPEHQKGIVDSRKFKKKSGKKRQCVNANCRIDHYSFPSLNRIYLCQYGTYLALRQKSTSVSMGYAQSHKHKLCKNRYVKYAL